MGTGGKPKQVPNQKIHIVASRSNSGYELAFEEEDMFLNEEDAKQWCAQKNASIHIKDYNNYFVRTFKVKT